jgi:hypothetical protein
MALLVTVWLVACMLVFVVPSVGSTTRADAVLVLGPPNSDGRIGTALDLISNGMASNLVVSSPTDIIGQVQQVCNGAWVVPAKVYCFQPKPSTTQGEARELRALAARHHWTKVIVVTSRYHIARAELLLKRCYSGSLEMVEASSGPSLMDWAYEFVYQTGAYAKAYISSGC